MQVIPARLRLLVRLSATLSAVNEIAEVMLTIVCRYQFNWCDDAWIPAHYSYRQSTSFTGEPEQLGQVLPPLL